MADTAAPTGTTVITDNVVSKIAGIAAREVPGVYGLGGSTPRALGAILDAISGTDLAQGVSIELSDSQVVIDLSLVATYPTPLQKVADDVRAAVITAIETLVGLQVTAVNVTVTDVHVAPRDDAGTEASE